MVNLKDKVKGVIDDLIDKSMLKDCLYDVALRVCCKELDMDSFTVRRMISHLKWTDGYYFSPKVNPVMLRRVS